MLGFDLLDLPSGGSFDDNLNQAARCGAQVLSLHLTWTQIETSPGVLVDPDGSLAAITAVCQAEGLQLSLTIRPIDLTGKTVPSDLSATRFNDPVMATRFAALIDHVLTIVPADMLVSLQVGNEIDGFDTSAEDAAFWSDYGAFLFAVTQHVHTVAPGLRTGFTCTLDGVVGGPLADSGIFQALAETVDVVGATYYPIDDHFQVRGVTGVADDLAALLAAFPGATIFLQEAGYPSAVDCGSSEGGQAAFVEALFAAWDTHRDRIPLVNLVRLNDLTPEVALALAGPYGISDPAFLAYLESLGLQTVSATEKEAFRALVAATDARGWTAVGN